ncbi:zinc-finger domain-containing protein [Crepidotus variabilis]|uniref:Zinc-finger domain-containing protein n=1 Tax=Crepidotus variabilis TaxID=179855 RepID=A0A9P6JND1_9AGAR|nr:zinc-finger domain-containing protein [Crepidotus variabilis]
MLGRRALPRVTNALKNISRSASTSTTSAAAIKANEAAIATHEIKQSQVTGQQAPNYATTWSTAQRPRPGPQSGPRFEQADMSLQPNPLSAMELIANEPIRLVQGRRASCDGGGPLGHPKVYINLDQPGPRPCGYCGIRFEQDPHHHH